jgi:hypothetical protein
MGLSVTHRRTQGLHGPLLSEDEYQLRIVELYRDLPPAPSREEQRRVRRAELDLTIDHRLGTQFPVSRRAALWKIQERVECRRGRLVLRYIFRWILPGAVERGATSLANYLLAEYREVLNQEEMEQFFGQDVSPSSPDQGT